MCIRDRANSLFEDNAEHGLGLFLGQKAIRDRLAAKTRELLNVSWCTAAIKEAGQKWLDTMEDGEANGEAAKAYIAALEDGLCTVDELCACPDACLLYTSSRGCRGVNTVQQSS